ncbi:hypothetical protein C2857_005999 [Epichloe festucae Fl1]|uniref:CCHC-type domain-containing protein n=1 Tax=Epichloe festucae (strain Fl1) TaxID=877507 RepID=A0A7S9PVY7_EPIFF|nr:hypothetical protein C2857_005999 [Epichloe festucae Fl1]
MAPETPKGVSSRLLTMKFMQRAVASTSSSGSPDSDAPSVKKRKLGQSPAPGRIDPNIDQALIQAALDDQEATRQAALEKHSAADSHWVLKTRLDKPQSQKQSRPLNIVYVGYGDVDSDDNNEDSSAEGRTSTKPLKQNEGTKGQETSDSTDESSRSSADDGSNTNRKRKNRSSDANSNTSNNFVRSRSQSRSRSDKESIRAKEFRDKRKKKEVRLNNLTSISSAGDGQFGTQSPPNTTAMKCYNCQQTGHKASDCSKKNARNRS